MSYDFICLFMLYIYNILVADDIELFPSYENKRPIHTHAQLFRVDKPSALFS